jgi:hypothetical protein
LHDRFAAKRSTGSALLIFTPSVAHAKVSQSVGQGRLHCLVVARCSDSDTASYFFAAGLQLGEASEKLPAHLAAN